jgi:uncharacterized protein DUF1848
MNQTTNSSTGQTIISASRRTDIPAFYIEWFMERIKRGFFNVTNPYNKITRRVDALPDKIHTIVFWSKNYKPFLESGAHDELREMGYNLFFHFSINSDVPMLEPGVPLLEDRLLQLEKLCDCNDPGSISWRFDPVCYYKTSSGQIKNNLDGFSRIVKRASALGIKRCITSFVDNYRKIDSRVRFLRKKGIDAPSFVDVDQGQKVRIVERMAALLDKNGIELDLCCEKALFADMREKIEVNESACISGKLFAELFKGKPDFKRDFGQRAKQGCKCTKSVDIGSYEKHPCFHNCLFCYASPAIDREL